MSNNKNNIPESWVFSPLIELLDSLESGSRPKGGVRGIENGIPSIGGEHLDSEGGFKLSNIRFVPETFADSMTKGKIELGDVLVVKDGATTGKVSYVGSGFPYKRAVVNEHVFLCRISKLISTKYIFYYLFSEQGKQEILEDFRGAAQGGISQRFANVVQVPLAPINEQTRIVEKLDELLSDLDAGVEELKSAQSKLVQYHQSLLKSAVEGTLTAEWRTKNTPKETGEELLQRILKERRKNWEEKQLEKYKEQGKEPPKGWQDKYPEPIQPDTKDLPELPNGWIWASIDQLADVGTGVTPLRSKSTYYENGNIGWITSGALNKDRVIEAKEYVTELALKECRLNLYPAGSLLIAMYGEGKTRGKCSELLIPATINQAIAALVLEGYSENVKAYLKLYLLNSYEKMRTYASGGVQPNLNLQIIKSISIPLPSIDEQTEINKLINLRFENIELQKIAVEVGIKKLINQRKNILRDAFSGKLVNQNIADEPVSILLERIQAQRKAQQSLPKQKRVIKKIKGSQNMAKTLIEVLAEAGNWLPAQEAFRRCGVSDGASTDEIEAIYSELRQLDQTKKLEVNTVYYDDGRKQFDRIRLLVKA